MNAREPFTPGPRRSTAGGWISVILVLALVVAFCLGMAHWFGTL